MRGCPYRQVRDVLHAGCAAETDDGTGRSAEICTLRGRLLVHVRYMHQIEKYV